MNVLKQSRLINSTKWGEIFGSSNPATDVETMCHGGLVWKLGIDNVTLNTLGKPCQSSGLSSSLDWLSLAIWRKDQLSKDSQRRLERKSLRVLDSKKKKTRRSWAELLPSRLSRWRKWKRIWCRFVECWKTWGYLCHRYQHGAWLGLLQPHGAGSLQKNREGNGRQSVRVVAMMVWGGILVA